MAKANLENDRLFLKFVKLGIFTVYKDGRVKNNKTGNFLGVKPNSRGYGTVCYKYKGRIRTIQVHRLIWLVLKGPISDPSLQINHKDGNKMNNHPDNHELLTGRGNSQHSYDIGLTIIKRGETNPNAKFTQKQVELLRKEFATARFNINKRARLLNVSRTILNWAIKGKTYKTEKRFILKYKGFKNQI